MIPETMLASKLQSTDEKNFLKSSVLKIVYSYQNPVSQKFECMMKEYIVFQICPFSVNLKLF